MINETDITISTSSNDGNIPIWAVTSREEKRPGVLFYEDTGLFSLEVFRRQVCNF